MNWKFLVAIVFGFVFSFTNILNVDAALPKRGIYTKEDVKKMAIGERLPVAEMQVVGVNIGTPLNDVLASLGAPDKYDKRDRGMYGPTRTLTYGGIRFETLESNKTGQQVVFQIAISNRDATTARGIAVGDSLEKLYEVYGQPTYMYGGSKGTKTWFYGFYKIGYSYGIQFDNDGKKITHIFVGSDG